MIPGIPIVLGGTEYIVPPLNLASLEMLQDKLGKFSGGVDADSVKTVLDATLAALRRNYPDMKRDFLAEHMDVANMSDVMKAVMDVGGLQRRAIAAGKSTAAAGSTGGDSTAT